MGNSELVKESSLVRLLVMGTRAGPETRLVNAPPAHRRAPKPYAPIFDWLIIETQISSRLTE